MKGFRKSGDAVEDGVTYFGPFDSLAEASDPNSLNEEAGLCSHEIDYSGLPE